MPVRFKIEVQGMPVFNRAFNRVIYAISDFTPIWDEVKSEFRDIEAENFQSENAKGASGRWAPLSASYEKLKIKQLGSFALIAGILHRTEDLYKSLTRDTKHSIYKASKDSMEIGTTLVYARFHQEGTDHMPARPPIDLSKDQKRRLTKRIQKSLLPYVRKAGFIMDESNFTDL